jgi:hypothetical protein
MPNHDNFQNCSLNIITMKRKNQPQRGFAGIQVIKCSLVPSHLLWAILILVSSSAVSQDMTSAWKFECQRNAIAPVYAIDKKNTFQGEPTLTLAGGGKEYADGHWYKIVNVEAGEYYTFQSYFMAKQVDEPKRSILARVIWQNEAGDQIGFTEYPITLSEKTKEGWSIFEHLYKVPAETKKAILELHYRWDADGMVRFSDASFKKTAPPASRIVRVATVHLKPRNSKSAQENLIQFSKLVAQAGVQKPDIVCLPEAITLVGTKENYVSASEPIPGP